MDGYDEDISENPFYKAFISKGKSLYNLAADNRWTICIPRKGTTNRSHHTNQSFETHILKPVQGQEENLYVTQNEKEVKVNGGDYIVTVKGFSDVKTVRVLFEETFFNPQEESYHILCIDQPLDGEVFRVEQPVLQNLETLQNCIEFLSAGAGSKRSRKKIDEVVDLFNTTYRRLETESIRHAMDAANAVFTRAMQTVLKEPHFRRPADGSKAFMDNLKVAIETYVMAGLYKRIFKGLCSFLANEDAELNKITRNLADLQVKDLGIKPQLCKNIPRAKKILSNLNRFATPLEKLYVLKLTVMSVSEVKDLSDAITADDLLPVLVFLVVKSEIPNWLANLTYMYNFHFSKSKHSEFQFYLSSIEASTEYVRSGKLNHLIGLSHAQRQSSLAKLFQRMDSTDKSQGPSPVETLFEEIRKGNIDTVLRMLRKGTAASKPLNEQLCHPLCSCDSCEKLAASKRNDPMAVTVFSRDDIGSTVLHPAAEFDQEKLLFELIKLGAVVNATNYHGSTPLHLACLRGHKKAAIMLTHYNGNATAADNDGNTPIHLAAANGHEKVVEALVLVAAPCKLTLKLNAANDHGDTPLHIAARWGFSNLVEILLENGASVEARNNSKETPIQCAANSKIQELLAKATTDEPQEQHYIYVQPNDSPESNSNSFPGEVVRSPKSPIASPKTKRKIKELQVLLKVVADGDLEMLKLKLGIPETEEDMDATDFGTPVTGLCHPLCQCSNCVGSQKNPINESLNQIVNTANEDGVTCLHIASLHGYDRIVALLLNRGGAFPNCRTNVSLKTPLHLACQYNHFECVSLLLKYGAKTDLKDTSGNTPLHFCCMNGHVQPAILLLKNAANVNALNRRGNTPLHESARWNWPDLVTVLLYYGASTKIRNKSNLTCLQYAQHDEVIELLRNADVEADETSSSKNKQQNSQPSSRSNSFHNSPVSFFDDDEAFQADEVFSKSSGLDQHENDLASSRADFAVTSKDQRHKNDGDQKMEGRLPTQRKTTISNLFQAYEEDDKEKLKELVAGIQKFDKRKKLRRVSTIDKSEPVFDQHLVQMLSIQHFDLSSLRHVDIQHHPEGRISKSPVVEDDMDLSEYWQKFEEDKEMDTIKKSSDLASDDEIDEKPSPAHSSQDHFHEKVQSNQTSESSNLSSVFDIEYRKTDLPEESGLLKTEVGSLPLESQQH
ncbi:ankyrin repeat domain-containing protein 27-like [Rhopilema esculentum]|uniref:ankyrin repeat domain-containing protein 27-like n=1 Tax=Rhopilema esculentum TaxID=499914 RepID=UPI0031E02F61